MKYNGGGKRATDVNEQFIGEMLGKPFQQTKIPNCSQGLKMQVKTTVLLNLNWHELNQCKLCYAGRAETEKRLENTFSLSKH